MNELAVALQKRSMRFGVDVMHFCRTLSDRWDGRFVADQWLRAGARSAANYRAACRARSRRDFIAKMGMAVEEADESVFWLTFCRESGLKNGAEHERLLAEAGELLAIFASSAKTASENNDSGS